MNPTTPALHPRARLTARHAIFPLDGYPPAPLPEWPGCDVRVLCGPAMGAGFAEYLIDLPKGATARRDPEGEVGGVPLRPVRPNRPRRQRPAARRLRLRPHSDGYAITATEKSRLVVVRKRYEPSPGVAEP